MSQPVVPPMPTCRDHGAPAFDPSKPWELSHFFEELKFHFGQSNVIDEALMKKHTLRFTDCDTAELWEILSEFANTAKTYQDFVDAVYKLYPGSDSERQWAITDMDKLVGEMSWVGILSLADLGKYHREFMAIMMFLIAKSHISPAEQSHTFVWGFPLELWSRVAHHLQLKLPNHFPDDPYTLEEIHDAVRFLLHGTISYPLAYDDQWQATQTLAVVTMAEPVIKTEDFTALLDVMKQAVSKMGNQGNQSKPSPPCDLHCHFCGGGHFKNSCDILKEYIHDGKHTSWWWMYHPSRQMLHSWNDCWQNVQGSPWWMALAKPRSCTHAYNQLTFIGHFPQPCHCLIPAYIWWVHSLPWKGAFCFMLLPREGHSHMSTEGTQTGNRKRSTIRAWGVQASICSPAIRGSHYQRNY